MRGFALFLVLLAVVTLSHCVSRSAHAEEFHIEEGDATLTLNALAKQASLQILFDYNTLAGVKTKPVDGDMQWRSAILQMLSGTIFVADLVNDRTIAVFPYREPTIDPSKYLRRFEFVAQAFAEGAGPRPSKLIIVMPKEREYADSN